MIVAADAEVDVTARRIAFGKFLNAGQTCIAPDYVLVVEAEAEFLGALLRVITEFYGDDASASPDYGRIVNERHSTVSSSCSRAAATNRSSPVARTTRAALFAPPCSPAWTPTHR